MFKRRRGERRRVHTGTRQHRNEKSDVYIYIYIYIYIYTLQKENCYPGETHRAISSPPPPVSPGLREVPREINAAARWLGCFKENRSSRASPLAPKRACKSALTAAVSYWTKNSNSSISRVYGDIRAAVFAYIVHSRSC
jgi:hypothetical protein